MLKKSRLVSCVPNFVLLLLVIQPLMDVVSYWLQELELSTAPILAARLMVLGVTVLVAFAVSPRKRVYFIAAGICLGIWVGHVFACMQVGYADPFGDLTNFIRVVQMPLTTLCLITFLRCNEESFSKLQLGLALCLAIMLLVELVAILTGTDPHTYPSGLGNRGWFSNTNSQSANLSVLLPLSMGWLLTREKPRPVLLWLLAGAGFAALYFFCTRLAYVGILAAAGGFLLACILVRPRNKKRVLAMGLVTLFFILAFIPSPMVHQMEQNYLYNDARQESVEQQLGQEAQALQALAEKARQSGWDSLSPQEQTTLKTGLEPIYTEYVGDFCELFGLEKTMEVYDYATQVQSFAAIRPKKLTFARMLMEDSPFSARLFGLELSRFTVNGHIYDVENDFHGIYYLYGWVGLGALLAFLLYFLGLILWALLKDFKKYFTLEAAGYGIALIMCLAHAYSTAGVLRRPNASIYLSAILAGVYFLVRLKKYPQDPAPEREAPEEPAP